MSEFSYKVGMNKNRGHLEPPEPKGVHPPDKTSNKNGKHPDKLQTRKGHKKGIDMCGFGQLLAYTNNWGLQISQMP